MKRSDEELSRAEFHTFLTANTKHTAITWKEVKQSDEPPDYYLYLENEEFAVEVTSIMEDINVSPQPRSFKAIWASIKEFVDDIGRQARTGGYLKGHYFISMSPLDNFGAVRNSLTNDLINYIHETRHLRTAPQRVVYETGKRRCFISKCSDDLDHVAYGISFDPKWVDERELCSLIAESLKEKCRKLSHVHQPKILLLIDVFTHGTIASWEKCLPGLSTLDAFHTIFRVSPSLGSSVLYSTDKRWMPGER